jgi:HTH-type transcriptional regulator, glycine betaine synthesis regulator
MASNPAPAGLSGTAVLAPSLGADARKLSVFECSVIEVFVRMADMLGMPRSIGEIYGLLYASPRPQAFQDIVDRLAISKGSASQGLRLLRATGAVKLAYVGGDRRDHFVPETELRALLSGFLREKIQPQLEGGSQRVKSLQTMVRSAETMAGDGADARVLRQRIDKLQSWHKRGKTVMPLIIKVFG